MTTLAMTGARAAGQSILNVAGQMALSYASAQIGRAFDNRVFEGPRLESFHLLSSRDGAPMPKVYGRMRLGGQVIWASRLKEHVTNSSVGGKGGGPRQITYSYSISFAIGLCEGQIDAVDRIWVNGNVLPLSGFTWRLYKGSQDQNPDPLIMALDGPDVPAFRGTAYIVFEDFPLDEYGGRLPQFSAEVISIPKEIQNEGPRLEELVRGVNLLPSSGEFAYATDIVEDVTDPQSRPINLNNLSGQADIEQALDQLQAQLPNCRHVNIIISWFGSDLRAGHCKIRPGVESRERLVDGPDWSVSGKTRQNAYLISRDKDSRPVFGGSPSDRSIVQAINTLKARGFSVGIYPFILMDIPPDNRLPNPDGGAGQPPFPWRGRIVSVADGTDYATQHIAGFIGAARPQDFTVNDYDVIYQGSDEGFARFILHYAHLAASAGGVDRFIIGSEMRGLTTVRNGTGAYPMVAALRTLAAQVRSIVGTGTGLTYAADWSEYFGYQPAGSPGDLIYHLDPLWSDSNIDFVGIDAYLPLSDWREGQEHLDKNLSKTPYEIDYLKAGIEGGEGFDWYYASISDRDRQIRTPITHWRYRYKDMRNWWANSHKNVIGGVETLTAWQAKSKPIWLTEIGCPAIDKGANQPNVFVDPKSSESHAPYYSSGSRDDLMQRRYLEAFLTYWMEEGVNPVSNVTGQTMLDIEASSVWCWDARPFPDFPARTNIWGDGPNWQLGHWLTGRMGQISLADIIQDICKRSNVIADTDRVSGLVQGYVLSQSMSGRAALEPLLSLYGIKAVESENIVRFISHGAESHTVLTLNDLIFQSDGPIREIYPDQGNSPLDVRLHFIDSGRDYQSAAASAQHKMTKSKRVTDISAPLVLDQAAARQMAKSILAEKQTLRQMQFKISPARLDLEVGDLVSLPQKSGRWQITEIDNGQAVAREALIQSRFVAGGMPEVTEPVPWVGRPEIKVIDIVDYTDSGARIGPLVGASVLPFNKVSITGVESELMLDKPAAWGYLLSPLSKGTIFVWDEVSQFDIRLPRQELSASSPLEALNGHNRFAVKTQSGWEIIQARQIELIAPDSYSLSGLLRGLYGSDIHMAEEVSIGAEVAWLDDAWQPLAVSSELIGTDISITGASAGRDSLPVPLNYQAAHLRPLPPCHIKVREELSGGLILSWIRRSRVHGDSWAGLDVPMGEEAENYRVEFWSETARLATFEVKATKFSLTAQQWSNLSHAREIRISQASQAVGLGKAARFSLSRPI